MTIITYKNTKKEIYQAYRALEAESRAKTITPSQAINTASVIATEAQLLVRDCRTAASVMGQWFSSTVDELNRPLLRS